MSQMFLFYLIFYGGALVFLGGAGAPASPSLAPPMPKGILGWASGAERIERAEQNLQKGALRFKGNMTATLPAPAPLHAHALVCVKSEEEGPGGKKKTPVFWIWTAIPSSTARCQSYIQHL